MTCRASLAAALLISLAAALPLAAQDTRDWRAEAQDAIARGDGIAAEEISRGALEASEPARNVAPYLGRAELLQGDLDEARKWLEPGNFAESDWEAGFHALALLRQQEGDLPAAARAYDKALERGPGSAELWVDFGRLRYRGGEQHLARDAALTAIARNPDSPKALEFRAQLARDAQGPMAAATWFGRALEQAPDDVELLGEYAAILGDAGRYREMLAVVRHMVEIDPGHSRIYFLQAVLAARAGDDNLARRLLNKTGAASEANAAALLLSGVIELRNGNGTLAVEHLSKLLDLQPQNRLARILYGRALLASGEANEAAAQLSMLADRPDAGRYLLTLTGRAYEQSGDRAAAARYLDRAASVDERAAATPMPPDEDGELLLFRFGDDRMRGDVAVARLRQLFAQGRIGEARTLASQISARYPQSSDFEVLSGDVLLLAGNPGGALAKYDRSARIRRPYSLVRRMVSAQLQLGNQAEARKLLQDHIAQNPLSGEAALALAQLEYASGRFAQAAAYYDYAIRAGYAARDPAALDSLARIQLSGNSGDAAWHTAGLAYSLQRSNGGVTGTLARIAKSRDAQPLAAIFGDKSSRTAQRQ